MSDLSLDLPTAPPTEERVLPDYEPASMGARVGAAALELLLFGICLGIGWLLWWITLWDHGTTPAKAVLKLRVASVVDGGQPSSLRMAAHEALAKLLSPLALVTAAVALVDDDHRSLWDHVTGTVVIRDRQEAASTDPR
ncbi:MAG: hypothetical protein QOE63_1331 [Acidimicrobiaceae bacterium]